MKRYNIHIRRLGEDPSSDWNICLGFFFVALVAIALLDALLYSTLVKNPPQPVVTETPASISASTSTLPTLDPTSIKQAVEQAKDTEATYATIPPALIHDPSL